MKKNFVAVICLLLAALCMLTACAGDTTTAPTTDGTTAGDTTTGTTTGDATTGTADVKPVATAIPTT